LPENKKKNNRKFLFILIAAAVILFFVVDRSDNRIPSITIEKNGEGYSLVVNGKPTIVRGVCYSPIPIGRDYEYNFWGAPEKAWIADGKLMKAMGVNTIRFYKAGKNPAEVRAVMDGLYKKYGIRTLMGTYLGFWNWPPPNYADEDFREMVRTETLEMVRLYKDSPGLLMWVLGNENNYSFDLTPNLQRWTTDAIDALPTPEAQREEKARIYYSFVNDLAKEIKKIDPKHPVIMGAGETSSLQLAQPVAPDIDVIGMIAYRGPSFGNLFRQVKQKFDKPVLMIEYGADSFNALKRAPDEKSQAQFLKEQWRDIARNSDPARGGNCLGGVIFEWNDEWWKGNENLPHTWSVHEEAGHWANASYYYDAEVSDHMNMNEEWFGLVGLEPSGEENGIDKRVPKKAYAALQALWTKKGDEKGG
jgi:beta-galactosidase/beta-glucuronidase